MPPRSACHVDENARSVLLNVSPSAGARSRSDQVEAVEAGLTEAGFEVHVTTDLDELASVGQEWHRAGRLRAAVACGGDGTASFVRNRLPLDIPLLPLPLGTENLLSRYVSQSASPRAVCETLAGGVTIGLDLGKAGDHFFLMMISAGFDAEVIRRFHEARSGHITRLAYVEPTLQTIRSYNYPEIQLYCDEQAPSAGAEPRCRWLFGFNLPLYACGWQLAPDAVGIDGLLDVCKFERGSLLGVVRYWWHVVRHAHLDLADVELRRCRRFRMEAVDGAPVPYQLDGDFAGVLPVDVEVLPGQLQLLVSPAVARRLGFAVPLG